MTGYPDRVVTRDWRVLYSDTASSNVRSKPFNTEEQAVAWAISWVKGQHPDNHPMAHVAHRTKVSRTGEDQLDPTPRSHQISWAPVGDELRMIKQTWPSQSRAAHDAELRRVLASLAQPDGAKVHTVVEIVDDMPLRAL